MTPLVSPVSGRPLRPDGPDALTDGSDRWPVLDGIPYLRVGREPLVADMLAAIAAGDRETALVLALADQDEWWDGPTPSEEARRRLVRERDALSLRQAMDLLALGRVGDYFAHRWSDPTYLAGLALLDAHWTAPASAFELACGIGHYLRDLALRGVDGSGADIVFAKLWLARHWVCPEPSTSRARHEGDVAAAPASRTPRQAAPSRPGGGARQGRVDLVCFDASAPWPVAGRSHDLVLCHDAFYFLEPKVEILRALRGLVRPGGTLAVGHVHNREAENLSAGSGVTAGEIAGWFPGATVYDDADLTRAAAAGRPPVARAVAELGRVEAFSLADGPAGTPGESGLLQPEDAAQLRLNPLYRRQDGGAAIAWPSERYRREYAEGATYRPRLDPPIEPGPEAVRRREFVALPERW